MDIPAAPAPPDVLRRRNRWSSVHEAVTGGLWFVPMIATLAAWALAWLVITIDRRIGPVAQSPYAFSGGPSSAHGVLSTIATAVLGFTGLVFSIMIVALQLASSQFSPRVLRTFLRDRGTKFTLGIFVGTFVYTLTVLQAVREGTGASTLFVPGDAISLAIGLVLITVLTFVYFVHHMANSVRVVSIIEAVADETRAAIDANFPPPVPPEEARQLPTSHGAAARSAALAECATADGPRVIDAPRAGVLTGVDAVGLVALAKHHDLVIEMTQATGDYVPQGAPLVRLHGTDTEHLRLAVHQFVGIAQERTMHQDVAFGFRQLVDIGERAMSAAINDPTTAVQAIDRIHDLLRRLAVRPFPNGVMRDADGAVRLVLPTASWREMVILSFAEIRSYSENSLQVSRRLRAAIEDLITVASPERQVALLEMLTELSRGITRGFSDPVDRARARMPDAGGLGTDDEEDASRA